MTRLESRVMESAESQSNTKGGGGWLKGCAPGVEVLEAARTSRHRGGSRDCSGDDALEREYEVILMDHLVV